MPILPQHEVLQSSPIMTWPRAVYVHVPFCLHHCGYCDFTLVANRDHLIPEYLRLLAVELERLTKDVPKPLTVDTIFIGGGTPTHLSPADLQTLLDTIHRHFRLSADGEYSIEANPDALCDERLNLLRTNGVTRLSLGVQSFDPTVLKTLERQHSPESAIDAVQRAAQMFDNVSLDLIFGVPSQSLESWHATLQTAMSLPIQHISTYGLTYEQGTPFFRRERAGALHRTPDLLERQMYQDGIAMLADAGFRHYEVSNFAKPDFQCRHNRVYWNADEYFAFGPGAARYLHGIRSTNVRSVVKWLRAVQKGDDWIEDREELTAEEKARESIMLALRMTEGLNVDAFERRFEMRLADLAGEELSRHVDQGNLVLTNGFLRLTPTGLMIADTVVSDFL
jgi:oxygen-independent coproporphyrinogen-3 oxidase